MYEKKLRIIELMLHKQRHEHGKFIHSYISVLETRSTGFSVNDN